MKTKIFIATIILILLFSGCIQPPIPKPEPLDDSKATDTGVKNLVQGNNEFALELYSEINKEGENLFFSPWSISSASAMVFEGAKGETAQEMQSVLHFPENDLERRSAYARIYNKLNTGSDKYTLKTANALWAQKDYSFLEEFINVNKKYFSAEVTNLDFVNKTEESRKTINSWVEEQTNNKIKDLIPAGQLDPTARMVLTNAIYFKGTWETQFDKSKTKKEDFKINETETIQVDMMSLKEGSDDFKYTETEEIQILEMPYEGENLSMLVILPKNNLSEVEAMLSAEKLAEWKKQMHEREVYVFFPKFKFETKYFLSDTLKEMGMQKAFSESEADFSGMDGTKNLYIDFVIHQAFVEVNEEGTEAAAATAVGMVMSSAPQYTEFKADHPFIFLIQEKSTGSILFMGKVVNPNSG